MEPEKNPAAGASPRDNLADHPGACRVRSNAPPRRASGTAQDELRRGVCLLNAGRFEEACAAFARAAEGASAAPAMRPTPEPPHDPLHSSVPTATAPETHDHIRRALELAASGKRGDAMARLRDAIRERPECAELHYQLALLLAAEGQYDEAELRFIQVLNIHGSHVDAMVDLALCCAAAGKPRDAIASLERAQAARPNDARIGLLLAQATRAACKAGETMRVRATMPATETPAAATVRAIVGMIEHDADVAEALLASHDGHVNRELLANVAAALEDLVERYPQRADFRFQLGRANEQLGLRDAAIVQTERAAALDPTLTRAMIELGRLYQLSNQRERAIEQLERATERGGAYADVYFRLGNLYREAGRVEQARGAFEKALSINGRYAAAAKALEAIRH